MLLYFLNPSTELLVLAVYIGYQFRDSLFVGLQLILFRRQVVVLHGLDALLEHLDLILLIGLDVMEHHLDDLHAVLFDLLQLLAHLLQLPSPFRLALFQACAIELHKVLLGVVVHKATDRPTLLSELVGLVAQQRFEVLVEL